MGLVLGGRRVARRASRASGGYSLVEVLLGLLILMVALVGLMPLFTRSIQQNVDGKHSSEATGHGRTELEDLKQLDFNNWEVTVTAGTERERNLYWSEGDPTQLGDEYWATTEPSGEVAPWLLTSTVRQYGIQGVEDTDLDGIMETITGLQDNDYDGVFDAPLVGGSAAAFVHLKSLDVELVNRSSVVTMGGETRVRLNTLKAF